MGKTSSKTKKPTQKKSKQELWKTRLRLAIKWVGIPLLVYFAFFVFYTWPWITHFSSSFFTDVGDGFQNVWNIWWINESVTQLHQLPWYTRFLHFPWGVTLLGQTLNPFNGFVAIGLLRFMSLVQAFNTMVIFSFLTAGLTAFWLCYYFSKSYIASIAGGFIYTFSSYHLAHALGHMQLISLEWIPLFILLWWMLLKKPRYLTAAGASISLLLVLLCDYYYFLYCLLAAGLIVLYFWARKQLPPIKDKKTILPFALFGGMSLLLVAPLPLALLRLNSREVLTGSHPARALSTNLLAPFIDGGFWRFGWLTDWYWRHVPAYVAESSVYIGLSVWVLIVVGWFKRKKLKSDIVFWFLLGIVFGVFSLGPRLAYGGHTLEAIPMPYALLERIFPPLKLSGVPVRMMVMVTLSAAVISAIVLSRIKFSSRNGKIIFAVFASILFIEMWPGNLPMTPAKVPDYVYALKSLPSSGGGVFDNGAETASHALYNQTVHEKPMALGYISRTPQSVEEKDWLLVAALLESRYSEICSVYRIRYYATSNDNLLNTNDYPVVYQDEQTTIYDLKNSNNC